MKETPQEAPADSASPPTETVSAMTVEVPLGSAGIENSGRQPDVG